MERASLESMRLPELKEVAKTLGMHNYHTLRKADLIQAILARDDQIEHEVSNGIPPSEPKSNVYVKTPHGDIGRKMTDADVQKLGLAIGIKMPIGVRTESGKVVPLPPFLWPGMYVICNIGFHDSNRPVLEYGKVMWSNRYECQILCDNGMKVRIPCNYVTVDLGRKARAYA